MPHDPLNVTLPLSAWLDARERKRRASAVKVDTSRAIVCGDSEDRRLARQAGNRDEYRARKGEMNP